MRSGSVALSVGLALLLVASLAGKFVSELAPFHLDEDRLAHDVALDLQRRGFAVQLQQGFLVPLVAASQGACRMLVRDMAPSGENAGGVEQDLHGLARRSYQFDGVGYDRPPRIYVAGLFYIDREAVRLGLREGWPPLLAIGDNGQCGSGVRIDPAIRAFPKIG